MAKLKKRYGSPSPTDSIRKHSNVLLLTYSKHGCRRVSSLSPFEIAGIYTNMFPVYFSPTQSNIHTYFLSFVVLKPFCKVQFD